MCQFCWYEDSSSMLGDVLVPKVTWLRQVYKRICHRKKNSSCYESKGTMTRVGIANQIPHKVERAWGYVSPLSSGTGAGESQEAGVDSHSHQHSSSLDSYQKTQAARTRETEPPFPLQKNGIRVLLFRDCDTRGRKLLYDSKTVVRVPLSEAPITSPSVPSCKTLFKASWGVSAASGAPLVGSSGVSQTGQTMANKSNNARASTSATFSKPDVYAEVSGGYGYQVSF